MITSPWNVVHNHPACRKGEWAVVNQQAEAEGRHSIEGCHGTRQEALAQQRALYAKEPQMHSLTALIEQKTVSDAGSGEITGLAAVYGNVDLQDDMVESGAANKTVADWSRSKSRLPLMDWHGESIGRLIGSVVEMKSIPQGVWFRAQFTKDEQGQRARQLAKDGHLTGVSIGYLPIRQSMKMIGQKMVRVLHEIRIHEISLTPVPANPEAQLASVKSVEVATTGLDFEQFTLAAKTAANLPEMAYKAAMAALLDTYQTYQPQAAGPADGPSTADDAAPTEDPSAEDTSLSSTDDASAYALALITPPGPRDGAPDGKPPNALAYPQQLLESVRQQADLDRLEAEINQALGRAG